MKNVQTHNFTLCQTCQIKKKHPVHTAFVIFLYFGKKINRPSFKSLVDYVVGVRQTRNVSRRAICDLKKENKSISVSLMIINLNYSEGSSIFLLIIVSFKINGALKLFWHFLDFRKWVKQFPDEIRAISVICCCCFVVVLKIEMINFLC